MPTQIRTSDNQTAAALQVALDSGAVAQIHFNRELTESENILVTRSIDGGSTYAQPVRDADAGNGVAGFRKGTGQLFGPGWFEVTKPATDTNLLMAIDT